MEIPPYVPPFLWKFWLSTTKPNGLPRDPRLHAHNVYDNDLSEIRDSPHTTRFVLQDLISDNSSRDLVESIQSAFQGLELDAEKTLTDLIARTYMNNEVNKSTSFSFDGRHLTSLCRYLVFLRFRNSAKYREILESLKKPIAVGNEGCIPSFYQLVIVAYCCDLILHDIMAFLENLPPKGGRTSQALVMLNTFQMAMQTYCWRFSGADVCIGIAVNDQEFILPDSCYATLSEGFKEDPECSDLFFPVLPTFALYILGNSKNTIHPSIRTFTIAKSIVEVGIESTSDVHLRNSMILQTYPRYLYFSALRSIALSVSSYDEFRWIPEHQDYSRLKQRCRQKFLQETVTKTLVVKGSITLTDLTDEVAHIGACPVGYGAFADVWKAVWNDPVERRVRHVALKVLRKVMVKNVQEKLMKRLQAEVVAWHRLCHRNVSQLFGVVRFHNSIGMVSLWCENGILTHYLQNNTTVDRLSILIQIASGVAYLHSATPVVIHGDLKGGNILINGYGCPIITDFGLSKVIEDFSDSMNIHSSFFAGSTRWMAPELIRALIEDDPSPPVTKQSDAYAFASLCLEVATGSLPYPHRSNDHAVTVDILRGIKPSRGTHCLVQLKSEDAFWRILDKCWDEAPYLRPTMQDLVRILGEFKFR